MSRAGRRAELWLIVALTLFGFAARVWMLERVPPGWRDDELIETLVISQKMLDGDLALYYPDASGHEAGYHALNAIFLAAFGPTGPGIRLLSAFLGTLAIPLTYLVGRKLFGPWGALAAAAMLAASFWGLMYSRVGIRHVMTPPLALAAFYWFWRGLTTDRRLRTTIRPEGAELHPAKDSLSVVGGPSSAAFALSGLFLGLGFYAYFASRGVPLIVAAFAGYLLLFASARFRARWRGIALTFAVAVLLALPLWLALRAQPQAEGRISELAMPLNEARAGNFAPLAEYARAALTMASFNGDPEWLYNIPDRPVFGVIGSVFFWTGMALAVWWALRPVPATARYWLRGRGRGDAMPAAAHRSQAAAFLLIWWLAGISPAFLSVPPASLGHVIVAQPAFYLLAALPLAAVLDVRAFRPSLRPALAAGLGLLLISSVAVRDLSAYFGEWPERGMVRYLYRADLHDVAEFVRRDPAAPQPADFGITGLLAGPWDRVALEMELDHDPAVQPRWYDPRRALLLWPDVSFAGYPEVESPYASSYTLLPEDTGLAGDYELSRVARHESWSDQAILQTPEAPVCFANGLCWQATVYDPAAGVVELEWKVDRPLDLPPLPLISNPPPPGVYSGPRLYVFAQLLDDSGAFLAGDDGLWVDPQTLQPGDVFVQRHLVRSPQGSRPAAVAFGLYDPLTGERILTVDGQDSLRLELSGQE